MRPKNWKNPDEKYYKAFRDMPTGEDATYEAFEAGADAMLEGLFEMAKESPTGTFVIDSRVVNIFNE